LIQTPPLKDLQAHVAADGGINPFAAGATALNVFF